MSKEKLLQQEILRDLKKISLPPDPRREVIAQITRNFPEVIVQLLHTWLAPAMQANRKVS